VDGNELSRKEQHQLSFDWHKLVELCSEKGRAVTAGEFADFLGIARSTAARRLMAMVDHDGATTIRGAARNRFPKITYLPVGLGDTWSFSYGAHSAAQEY